MRKYKCISQSVFSIENFHIEPIRDSDKYEIMTIRNEQLYHLRQEKLLTVEDQDTYFNTVVNNLFEVDFPSQILFSFFKDNSFIGYGGLVHINWKDKNAEISFVMKTELEKNFLKENWSSFLKLIENVAFQELHLHKIATYAFDVRPHLYEIFEHNGYKKEAVLKEHIFIENQYIDVVIHAKLNVKKNNHEKSI